LNEVLISMETNVGESCWKLSLVQFGLVATGRP